jgi:hypothetical protein
LHHRHDTWLALPLHLSCKHEQNNLLFSIM